MEAPEQQLHSFFEDYETRFNDVLQGKPLNEEATVSAFASCFVEASPVGVICGQNDKKFRESLGKGYERYKKVGTRLMKIRSKNITRLNELHSMVAVQWHSEYEKKDGEKVEIDFEVIYLLQWQKDAWKVFAYVTGDEQQAMKDKGLL